MNLLKRWAIIAAQYLVLCVAFWGTCKVMCPQLGLKTPSLWACGNVVFILFTSIIVVYLLNAWREYLVGGGKHGHHPEHKPRNDAPVGAWGDPGGSA